MDAKCPECGRAATLDDDAVYVRCHHCGFEADYDRYIQIMKDVALNMAADYIPDRPGL